MGRLQQVIAELRRRRVFRALLGWAVVSFAVLQVVEPVMHGLDLPGWTLKAAIWALAAGFPIASVLAWIFDLGPGGVSRTPEVLVEPTGVSPPPPRRLGLALASLVAVSVLLGAGLAVVALRTVDGQPPQAPSIAVLPFADMSPGRDQEYLSEGVAEEILNSLARIEGLRVVGRTSSWYFKGKNARLEDIGRELRVGAVLEGSVRREGSRLRVAAKLLAVPDGRSLWAESYDRELGDVFALQEGVASAVAGALRVKLLAGSVAEVPRTAPEAYLKYLLGYQLWVRGYRDDIRRSVEAFEEALAIDPRYAPAWAGLAWSLEILAGFEPTQLSDLLAMKRRALEAANRAVELGPGQARGYYARGGLRAYYRHEWREAVADLERAISLQGNDSASYRVHGWILGALGRLPDAIASLRKATDLEPLAARGWMILGWLHTSAGDLGQARKAFLRIREIAPDHQIAPYGLAMVHLLEGRAEEALATIRASRAEEEVRLVVEALAEHTLGHDAASRLALDRVVAGYSISMAFEIATVHAWRGERDEAFAWLDRADAQMDNGIMYLKVWPLLRDLHGDPRWKPFLRKLNLPSD